MIGRHSVGAEALVEDWNVDDTKGSSTAIAAMRFNLRAWLAGLFCCYCIVLAPGPNSAQEQAEPAPQHGSVQIFRSPRETVIVISGVGPVDRQSGSMAHGDLPGQMKQALVNLRRTAIRAGVLPGQIVTITVFTPEVNNLEVVKEMPRQFFKDWAPLTAVEIRELSRVGALIEIEAVAIFREGKPR